MQRKRDEDDVGYAGFCTHHHDNLEYKKNADCIIYSVHDIAGSSDTRDNEKLADVKELAMGYRQTIKNNYLWNNGKSSV